MTKDQYLSMMEQLGREPIEEEIPVDFEDLPYLVQQALNIHSILIDIWDGMSGAYFGKDFSLVPYLAKEIFEIEDEKQLMKYLLLINNTNITNMENKRKQRESAEKAKAAIKKK